MICGWGWWYWGWTAHDPRYNVLYQSVLPALTFRAWFESQFGLAAWQAMDKIPRLQWADYLRWYRQVLGLEMVLLVSRAVPHWHATPLHPAAQRVEEQVW